MEDRNVVGPRDGYGWEIKLVRDGRTISVQPTKEQAVTFPRKVAASHAPSALTVQRADGTIETEYTYGPPPS